MRRINSYAAARGFTLIELMIVLAIVAILTAIAFPSYVEHVARGRRADAKGALLEAAQWLEREYTISSSYAANGAGDKIDTNALKTAPLTYKEGVGIGEFYTLQFAADPTRTAYTLQMVPIVGKAQATDKCGTLSVTQTGQRGQTGETTAYCWNR
jgi:type IV pilus assembly protein PilE